MTNLVWHLETGGCIHFPDGGYGGSWEGGQVLTLAYPSSKHFDFLATEEWAAGGVISAAHQVDLRNLNSPAFSGLCEVKARVGLRDAIPPPSVGVPVQVRFIWGDAG